MAIYTVHRDDAAFGAEALERAVVVREGFSWPAFLVPLPWLLWNRLWLGLLAFMAVSAALIAGGGALGLPGWAATTMAFLISLYTGLEGNALRRAKLARAGFSAAGVVGGVTRDEAERRAIALLVGEGGAAPTRATAAAAAPVRVSPVADVLGSFPEPNPGL